MNFIWDITLQAEQNGMNRMELFFRQAETPSPWYEQSFLSLNQKQVEDHNVEINGLFRFAKMFQEILHPDMTILPSFREYLFDLVIHLLCEMELHQGFTKREFYIRRLVKEIKDGIYGDETARDFKSIPYHIQIQLTSLVFCQIYVGESLMLFRRSVRVACPKAILYQLKETQGQLLLYMGHKKTEQLEQKVRFLMNMFLPIQYQVRIFWEHHFGVIGVDATMQLDEIEIF